MNDEQTGWVAGFIEGEGCFSANRVGRARKDGVHPYRPRIAVAQVSREPLDRLLAATGVGRIYGPYANAGQGAYHWIVQKQQDVDGLVCSILHLLSSRRIDQINAMYQKERETRAPVAA